MTTLSINEKQMSFQSEKGQLTVEMEPARVPEGKTPNLCTWETTDGSQGFQRYVYTIKELGALVRHYL